MYVNEILARVQSQVDFAPQSTPGFTKYLVDTINDAYNDIWYERAWTFNTKTVDLAVYPDMSASQALYYFTGKTDVTTYPLVCEIGSKLMSISVTGVATPPFYNLVQPKLLEQLFGAYIYVDGRDYQIVDISVVDSGADYTLRFYVDVPFITTGALSTNIPYTNWAVKFKEYKLPSDLTEIEDISWNNNRDVGALRTGQAISLPERNANDVMLNYQLSAAKPYAYIPKSYSIMSDVNDAFTVTQNTGSGTAFGVGTYFFAWEIVDLVTGASTGITQPITVVITATNIVSLTFTDDRTLPSGQMRRLLAGTKRTTNSAIRWLYLQDIPLSSVAQPYDTTTNYTWRFTESSKTITITEYSRWISISTTNAGYRDNLFLLYYGNIDRKNVIFYPRLASADQNISGEVGDVSRESIASVRYLYKCAPLADDYEAPQFPAEFHNLLVWKTLEAVCLKFDKNTQANYYAKKYTEGLTNMLKRYGNEQNTIAVRTGSMGIRRGWSPYGHINYTGGT